MRIAATLSLAAALAFLPGSVTADEEHRIDNMSMGTYWYGAKIEKEDLVGTVVLLEIWGS